MGAGCPPSVPGAPHAQVLGSLQDHWLLLFHFQNFFRFFSPFQTLMGSQGGSLHSAGQTLLPLFSKCNFGTCLARKICFSPQRAGSGRSWAEAGEPASVVGKRLRFPWSSSLLIPVFSPFSPSCFTFALADRIYHSSSPCNNFCPGSSHVSLLGWDCSPYQMIKASPHCWHRGLWSIPNCSCCPRPLLLWARGAVPTRVHQPQLWFWFDFMGKGIFPKLLLS